MKLLLYFLIFSLTASFTTLIPCQSYKEKRIVKGEKPISNTLYQSLQNIELGSWQKGFWIETFTYIGIIESKNGHVYKIGYLTTIWGQSCRATNRLFVFNKNNLVLGQYGGINDQPIKILNSKLFFPYRNSNSIDFSNGPPSKIHLDGQNFDWYPVKSIR